jgi:biopolymer transport protein ExbD
MRVRYAHPSTDKVEQQMTSMIDIVFQLLAFFVMSFKLATVEGNFDVKMPLHGIGTGEPSFIRVSLQSTEQGVAVRLNSQTLGIGKPGFHELRQRIIGMVGPGANDPGQANSLEAEIDCDYDVPYDNVIQAITAVSGYTTTINGELQIVKLIEKIKFAQPRKATGE